EDQVNPVMSTALDAGLEVTALHNHFFWDNPKVMFMHIGGMGDEAELAAAVGKVFARIQETRGGKGDVPRANIDPAKSTLDPKKIDAVLRASGELKSGVYKVTIGRETQMHGETMGKHDGRQHVGRVRGERRQGGRRRRLRDAGVRAPRGAQGAARRRDRHR